MSYPYVIDGDGERRYLLFYRWVHWSLLTLAGLYYIPRKISKSLENPKAKKLMEDLAANAFRYDQVENELVQRAAKYVTFNLKTHNSLYINFVSVNAIALIVDIITMQFLDFILQGRFISYGFMAYPFKRDPKGFTDYMSQTFPPFATCELAKNNKLVNKRTEEFGCHLTIMELYEKVFLGLWLWLIVLIFITSLYLVFLFMMMLPCVRVHLLRTAKPLHANDKVKQTILRVSHNCKVGDMYLLYRLKQHLSHARFYELLARLSDPELCKVTVHSDQSEKDKLDKLAAQKQQQLESLRNRKPQHHPDPPMNPEYLHLLNPEMPKHLPPNHPALQGHKGMPGQQPLMMNPDLAQKTPLIKKNTSILIE